MKSVFKIAIKGIFKRKTYTIAIFVLTIIAAVSMVTALATIFRTQDIYTAAYQKSNSPDIFYFYASNNYSPQYVNYFNSRSEVKDVISQDCLLGSSNLGSINGKDLSSCVFTEYNPTQNDFAIAPSSAKADYTLDANEVYVPLLYKSQYNAKIGDKLVITTNQGNMKYIIKGFFEDPVFGSVFMGNKRILFSSEGYKQIGAFTLNKTTIQTEILNVYLKSQYQGANFEKTAEAVNKDFGKDTLAYYQSDKTFFESDVLVIPEIISVVLLCFSALLIIIVAIVIRHAILSSIEADYVSLGVLKAIGFTGKNIITSILLQYLIISGVGTVVGVIAGIFTTPVIGGILMNSTGIFGSANMTAQFAFSVIFAVLAVIVIISYLTARKAAKISPVMAISFGKAPVHFASRLNVPLNRLNFLPLSIKMSLKQMMTKLRQYSTLIVITTIFTFMIIIVATMASNFSTAQNMSKILGYPIYDMSITSTSTSKLTSDYLDQIVKYVDKTYGVKIVNSESYASMRVDGMYINGDVKSSFDEVRNALIDGRLPEFDNEIAVTPIMSKILGKGIGESLEIESGEGIKKEYIITGTIQSVSEMGKTVCMSLSAYQRIAPNFQPSDRNIVLKDNSNLDNIVSTLNQKYKTTEFGISFTNQKDTSDNLFSTIQSATGLASKIVLFLTFVLIACITILLCTITIYREITDTGIFKAIGFKTKELRIQFTFRFMLISIIGGVIGIGLSLLFDEKLLGVMLSSAGVANLKPVWNFSSIGIPILFVVCVTGITAFLCSAKIKNISPSSLINE